MKISELIEKIRESGLSVKNISTLSGVSEKTIEQWIYQGTVPTVVPVEKVLNALGYTLKISPKEHP